MGIAKLRAGVRERLKEQEAEIRAAAQAEIDKIQRDLDAKLKANAAQQAEIRRQEATHAD